MIVSAGAAANSPTPILLVEDDVGLRQQMQWALVPNPIIAASNRTEALELFEAFGEARAAPAVPNATLTALALRKKSRRSRELSEDIGAPYD